MQFPGQVRVEVWLTTVSTAGTDPAIRIGQLLASRHLSFVSRFHLVLVHEVLLLLLLLDLHLKLRVRVQCIFERSLLHGDLRPFWTWLFLSQLCIGR